MTRRLDEIDKRILYYMMVDARNIPAPTIAEEMNVSPGTIRNRLEKLDEDCIISGFHATVDFERAGSYLTNVFLCTAEVPDRKKSAREVANVPGVIDVRSLMAGRRNLHVTAVGEDMDDLNRIARTITELGIEIEEENLLEEQLTRPYEPFGPRDERRTQVIADFIDLRGGAELAEFTVAADAQLANTTIEDASSAGLIGEDILVITVERDDEMITPKGDTEIQSDDVVTLFARHGSVERELQALTDPATEDDGDHTGSVRRPTTE